MAYLCCYTDLNNQISFDVADSVPTESEKYLEFAKFVTNPNEKMAIISTLTSNSLSDIYMIFALMEGELWTPPFWPSSVPPHPPVLQRQEAIRDLTFETIEEEPEISDPD